LTYKKKDEKLVGKYYNFKIDWLKMMTISVFVFVFVVEIEVEYNLIMHKKILGFFLYKSHA